jgi:hypothetical protein
MQDVTPDALSAKMSNEYRASWVSVTVSRVHTRDLLVANPKLRSVLGALLATSSAGEGLHVCLYCTTVGLKRLMMTVLVKKYLSCSSRNSERLHFM